MRNAIPPLAALLVCCWLGACCSNTAMTANEPLPDWRGPAVHCRFLGDRSMQVELTAPTGGHSFTLTDVIVRDGRADAEFAWRKPAPDLLVTQAITPLQVDVGNDRLLEATAVWVWITDSDGARRLAVASARP